MKTEFNHAANDSPRSGSDKKVSPVVWAVIVSRLAVARRDVMRLLMQCMMHNACVPRKPIAPKHEMAASVLRRSFSCGLVQ